MKVEKVRQQESRSPLSTEFIVACEIWRYNTLKEPVWFKKLVQSLSERGIHKKGIDRSIDTLFDWGIIRAEYGDTEEGKKGRLYAISKEAKPIIEDLYEKYWRLPKITPVNEVRYIITGKQIAALRLTLPKDVVDNLITRPIDSDSISNERERVIEEIRTACIHDETVGFTIFRILNEIRQREAKKERKQK